MGRRIPGRTLLVSTIGLLILACSGLASAYWRAGGSGTGAAPVGTTTAVTLTPGSPTAALYPGGQSDVLLTVSNPNNSPVRIGSLSLDTGQGTGGLAVDAGHSGCTVASLSFTTQTNAGAGWTVPAKAGAVNGALAVTLSNALAMGIGAPDACQGASLTVYLAAGP